AGRDRLEPVFGLPAPERPHARAEADEVAAHLHPEQLGDPEVAELVQGDRHPDAEGEQQYAPEEPPAHRRARRSISSWARTRAQRSAARISATSAGGAVHCAPASSTASTTPTMSRKLRRWARKAAA